jgi:hypothetical protein
MFVRNRAAKGASIRIVGEGLPRFAPDEARTRRSLFEVIRDGLKQRFGSRIASVEASASTVHRDSQEHVPDEAPSEPAMDVPPDAHAFAGLVEDFAAPGADARDESLQPIRSRELRAIDAFARTERMAPLTRRRLRRHMRMTWPAILNPAKPVLDHTERLELLDTLLAAIPLEGRPEIGEILARAYLEEDGDGRILALRGLIAGRFTEGPSVFREALRTGNDGERSLAVDGLAAHARFEDLVPAFEDRIEAIAAKAALAYTSTASRVVFRGALQQHVSAGRLEVLLSLLPGLRD